MNAIEIGQEVVALLQAWGYKPEVKVNKPTSSKRYIAPCGESFAFGAKITMPKKKKRKNRR